MGTRSRAISRIITHTSPSPSPWSWSTSACARAARRRAMRHPRRNRSSATPKRAKPRVARRATSDRFTYNKNERRNEKDCNFTRYSLCKKKKKKKKNLLCFTPFKKKKKKKKKKKS